MYPGALRGKISTNEGGLSQSPPFFSPGLQGIEWVKKDLPGFPNRSDGFFANFNMMTTP